MNEFMDHPRAQRTPQAGAGLDCVGVLIVDDNRSMRVLVRSMLRAIGIRNLLEAADPAEAFEGLRLHPVDLVITDLAMRPLDGIEFTTMIRRSCDSPNPYVSVLMMTGHAERSRVAAARDAGVNSFLLKPLSAKALIERINAVVMDPRPFVKCKTYFGPDRRSQGPSSYRGPLRRATDFADSVEIG